ncbi:NUDIX domain-containing protein [Streptomyces sp. H10-C2]|uniref:NUDIX domain-containing protein n=1 Tax=unclassified Streptomyces TaxID=2593676 RepID=UPI0024BA224D|nr:MULTISPECIES: NUDIX domain-containing protein [unclassified Streptomyces]MDJ0346147.1 NUDIX domain-containing protein [Streptomyces sp. PH10-H1]MDJ0371591.1 NUDIX domain-containing protein [Streptomyces sp. H10-C2]
MASPDARGNVHHRDHSNLRTAPWAHLRRPPPPRQRRQGAAGPASGRIRGRTLAGPSGHLEPLEPTDEGTAREGLEEIGIRVHCDDLEFVHFIDHRAPGEEPRLGVFYRAVSWQGEPYNAEPAKCGGIGWYAFDEIPRNTVPYHTAALAHIAAGRVRSRFGWEPTLKSTE